MVIWENIEQEEHFIISQRTERIAQMAAEVKVYRITEI